jgi:hypothetical protein
MKKSKKLSTRSAVKARDGRYQLRTIPTMLPKFLLSDINSDEKSMDRIFVVHTEHPSFVLEFSPGGEGEFLLLDTTATAAEIDGAKNAARNFFSDD